MHFSGVDFPNLNPANHRITSPANDRYNCIAWAVGVDAISWEPTKTRYWPKNAPHDYNLTSLILALESVRFVICPDGSQEEGFEKVALYADGPEYMHAARQLESGRWTSKIGDLEDIEHDTPEDLTGPDYGQVAAFMKRTRSTTSTP